MLEDPGSEPLDRLLGQPMDLTRFLRFAVGLAAALGKLHQRGLIHKDIKPANMSWCSCRVTLGSASPRSLTSYTS